MKVFLSGLENSEENIIDEMITKNEKVDYVLTSYYYIRNRPMFLDKLKKIANEILVDSGAHSFQKGKRVKWEKYTQEYSDWITKNDNSIIQGYFEMDIDNVIGYDRVKALRKILEKTSNKIIPVWHKNRGIEDYKLMCKNYSNKMIAVTGFKNEDIKDTQYLMFLKYANKFNCKVHCLGMTRLKLLNEVPFYSVDSSTWKQAGKFGEYRKYINGHIKVFKQNRKYTSNYLDTLNFKEFVKLQQYYKFKWKD